MDGFGSSFRQDVLEPANEFDGSRLVGTHGRKSSLHLVSTDTVCREYTCKGKSPLVFAGGLEDMTCLEGTP